MENEKTTEELVEMFIGNVEATKAHKTLMITVDALLDDKFTEKLPIIHPKETFLTCIMGYFEYIEDYETCADIQTKKEKILEKLVVHDDLIAILDKLKDRL